MPSQERIGLLPVQRGKVKDWDVWKPFEGSLTIEWELSTSIAVCSSNLTRAKVSALILRAVCASTYIRSPNTIH